MIDSKWLYDLILVSSATELFLPYPLACCSDPGEEDSEDNEEEVIA